MFSARRIGGMIAMLLATAPLAVSEPALAQTPAAATPKAAQAKPKKPVKSSKNAAPATKAGKQDPAQALSMLEAGQASLKSGKHEQAVQQLSTAIAGGGLASADMARAFYLRGTAYRLQAKPALAIADLHSALWLKNGLKDADRKDALEQRAAAYRDAGLPDQGGGDVVRTAATGNSAVGAAAAVPPPPSVAATNSGSSSGTGFLSALFGGASAPASTAAPEPKPAAPAVASAAVSSWSTKTEPQRGAAGGKAADAKSRPVTTAAVASAPAARTAIGAAAGSYRVQVATARSRDDAVALVRRVQNEHGADLAGLKTDIQQGTFGGTTFYKVVVGPFADADASKPLCDKLKAKGLDCLGL